MKYTNDEAFHKETKMTDTFYIKIASYWVSISINNAELSQVAREEYAYTLHCPKQKIKRYIQVNIHEKNLVYTLCTKNGHEVYRLSVDNKKNIRLKEFLLQGFIELSLYGKNVFFVHSSCYSKNRNTYMFLGTPGKGKTTILRLMNEKNILSNDTCIIHYINRKLIVYPSPFDKKTGIKMLMKKRNGAINLFFLLQSPTNALSDMDLYEKLRALQENLNFFMMVALFDISSFRHYKSYKKIAHSHLLSLIRNTNIKRLSFNRQLTAKELYALIASTPPSQSTS